MQVTTSFAPSCGRSTRGERAALVTIVSHQRVDAAARRRQDARLRGRPHRRHDRRRVLRARRERQGARGDPPGAAAARPLQPERRPGRRVRPDLRRRRWTSSSSRSSRPPISTSSAPATCRWSWRASRRRPASGCTWWTTARSSRTPTASRARRSSWTTSRPGCSRPRSRPAPSSSSSPADTATTSRRCEQLAGRPLRYLGLIGSRAKVARVFDALEGEGIAAAALAAIHAPIGLDIGAVTPAEIAVSIVAELIAVRSGRIAEAHVAAAALKASLRR